MFLLLLWIVNRDIVASVYENDAPAWQKNWWQSQMQDYEFTGEQYIGQVCYMHMCVSVLRAM